MVRLVLPCETWGSLGSFGLVWLVRLSALGVAALDRVRLVRSGAPLGSLGSFDCAHGGAGFVLVCLVRPLTPCGSLGLLGFEQVFPGGGLVRSGSSDSSWCALRVTGFVRVRLVHPGTP